MESANLLDQTTNDLVSDNGKERAVSVASSNAPGVQGRSMSENASNILVARQLNKNKLNHRIFAQFMVDEDDESSDPDREPTAQTAATAAFGGLSDESDSRISHVDPSKSGNSMLHVPRDQL